MNGRRSDDTEAYADSRLSRPGTRTGTRPGDCQRIGGAVEFMKKSVAANALKPARDQSVTFRLVAEPVIRFTNSVGTVTDGTLFFWVDANDTPVAAVSQLVEQLRRHPPQPSKAADRVAGLYMIEISTGEVTLVAEKPDAESTLCGSPAWSNDGKRILFDAGRPQQVQRARLRSIELAAGELKMSDLGVGNCPTWSPAGDQIAFFLNPGGVPDAEPGVWLMNADGSQRRRLGSFGRPKWSPDGRRFMLIDFAIPTDVTLMDSNGKTDVDLQIPDLQIFTTPAWVSDDTIVAVVGRESGDTIALIDVTDPAQGKVKEVLWKANFKREGLDIRPTFPAYVPSTGLCVFIGRKAGKALYSFQRGQADKLKRLEPGGTETVMRDLALSPDGRFALFASSRAGQRQGGSPGRRR